MTELEQFYKNNIVATYSDMSFARLSNGVDLIDRLFSLEDVFFPIKMTGLQEYKEYTFNTIREDQEYINHADLINENNELIEEILSLLIIENDDTGVLAERENYGIPEKTHRSEFISSENVDSYNIGVKDTKDLPNDLLIDMILTDIAIILSKINKLDNGYKFAVDRRMVIGKPGSGKSTYIRRLALAFAYGENEFLSTCGYDKTILPIFIQFKRLSGIINERPEYIHILETDFEEFLYCATCYEFTDFGNRCNLKEFKDLLDKKIKTNSLLIVVDSFDEISEKSRYIFTKSLRKYLNNNSRLLICSREGSFDLSYSQKEKSRVTQELLNIPHLMYQNIYDLSDNDVKKFVEKWFDVVFRGDENNKIKVDKIVKSLYSHQSLYIKKIKRIPLYLTKLLCIAKNTGEFPKSKDKVLEQFVELCLNSSVSENSEYDNLMKQLSYLAYSMTIKSKKTIRESELQEILLECYIELDGSFFPEIPRTNVDEYIKWALIQWGRGDIFKVCRNYDGENVYQFEHSILQEYFTAYAISKLYCPNVNRRTQPIDILKPYLEKKYGSGWREIIIMVVLMADQRWGADEYVEKLINLANQDSDNYYYSNMLLEIVLSNTHLSRNIRYNVYKLMFVEHITDRQIYDVCDGIDNNSLSDEFLTYIQECFEKSSITENIEYQFVYAVIRAEECITNNINPLEFAASILSNQDVANRILGLYMMSIIAWCRYNNIVTKFTDCGFRINERVINDLVNCMGSDNIILVEAVGSAIKDMVIAGYFEDTAEYWGVIVNKCKSELPDVKKKKHIRKILSVLPINYSFVLELQDVIKKEVGEEIKKQFDESFTENKLEECIDSFVECALAHRWNYSEGEIDEKMRDLQALVLSCKGVDDAVKIRTIQLYRQISRLSTPIAAGISDYESKRFERAKDDFIFAISEGGDAKTNLGYMLRRGEIKSVVIDDHDYNVEELLENGINRLEPISLMNNALWISFKEGKYDYSVGKKYLSQFIKHCSLERTFSWWNNQARHEDKEGYVVLLWLIDLKIVDERKTDYDREFIISQLDKVMINLQ